VSQKVEHLSEKWVKKLRTFSKGESKSDTPSKECTRYVKSGESKSCALFWKV